MRVELLVFRVAHDQAIVGVPQDKGFRDRLDGVAEPDIGRLRALDELHLLGDVDGDADQMRLARLPVDQLGAGTEPDPASVGMPHPEHLVDRRLARLVERTRQAPSGRRRRGGSAG